MPIEMQMRFKQTLKETYIAFHKFCEIHNIRYFMAYGTAIGVARHQGFIPWDDDIDVLMPREDYEKLLSLQDTLTDGYSIMNYHNKSCTVPYSKFVNMNTTVVEFDYFPVSEGVSIDIFILDRTTESDENIYQIKQNLEKQVKQYQRTVYNLTLSGIVKYIRGFHFGIVSKVLFNMVFYRFFRSKYIGNLEKFESKLSSEHEGRWVSYYTYNKMQKEIFPYEWFESSVEMPFEDLMVPMAIGYDGYLTKVFGDYMTPPPIDKKVSHHSHYYCNLKEHLTIDEVRRRLKRGEKYV